MTNAGGERPGFEASMAYLTLYKLATFKLLN